MRRDPGVGIVSQCLVDHHRPQVRTADPDIDDGGDALPGGPGPLAAAYPVGEVAHGIEHLVHIGDNVLPVDHQLRVARQAQRRVQDRAVFGSVDMRAGEHRIAAPFEIGRFGQID